MHELIRLARIYTNLDDLDHYQTTRLAVPVREDLRTLGHSPTPIKTRELALA